MIYLIGVAVLLAPAAIAALSRWLSARVCLVQYDRAPRTALTAVVVQRVPSPRPLPRGPGPAITAPRIIAGKVETEEQTS